MKTLTLHFLTLMVFFSQLCFSQPDKKVISNKLLSSKSVMDIAAFDRTTWSLYAIHEESEYSPVQSELVIYDIDEFLKKPVTVNERQGEIAEYQLVKKYRNNLDSIFQSFKLFGDDQIAKFTYSKSSLPVRFALHKDSLLSMIITGVFIDNVYNTLKLTSRQRATTVLTTYLIPQFKVFTENVKSKEIKYFGLTAIYGSKDFASKSALATQAEFVSILIPTGIIKKYVTGDISEDELIAASDIYSCDRDMIGQTKKISVVLE